MRPLAGGPYSSRRARRALARLRVLGPDIEPFRDDVRYLWAYITELEAERELIIRGARARAEAHAES